MDSNAPIERERSVCATLKDLQRAGDAVSELGNFLDHPNNSTVDEPSHAISNRKLSDDVKLARAWIPAFPNKRARDIAALLERVLCRLEQREPGLCDGWLMLLECHDVGESAGSRVARCRTSGQGCDGGESPHRLDGRACC
jgi:hypothetical protein